MRVDQIFAKSDTGTNSQNIMRVFDTAALPGLHLNVDHDQVVIVTLPLTLA